MKSGARLSHYEILAPLGRGGMGEVWRARDTKLGREVAIKILPAAFADDPERLARFEREARLLASLSHPNIAVIHGLEESGRLEGSERVRFLVLELIEGQTLGELLEAGPLPVDSALRIAVQIAEALEAAHGRGVIHRDLKPGNIKVTPEGTVKVLDFGLAKALSPTSPDLSVTGDRTASLTREGTIQGTPAYMSPEQVRGEPVDAQTDIWAFGCVLFEMLTGRRLFEGATVSDLIAGVLRADPDWSLLPAELHPRIRLLLERCLERNTRDRCHAAADIRVDLRKALAAEPATQPEAQPRAAVPKVWKAVFLGVAVLAVLAALAVGFPGLDEGALPESRFDIPVPADVVLAPALEISPDGKTIVYVGLSGAMSRLWLRHLDSGKVEPLEGTEDAIYPFWKPDSRSIGFFAGGRLKRIDIDTGVVRTLAGASVARGGTWNAEGTILFAPGTHLPFLKISENGGEPKPLDFPDPGNRWFPRFLPDGRRFFYNKNGADTNSGDRDGIYVASLDEDDERFVIEVPNPDTVAYAPSGHLLFVDQGTLFARPFDADTLSFTGDRFAVADDVFMGLGGPLSVSEDGTVVYRRGEGRFAEELVRVDRNGVETGEMRLPSGGNNEVSPDGKRVLGSGLNVVLQTLETGRRENVPDTSTAFRAVFSSDSARIVFNVRPAGSRWWTEMHVKTIGSTAPPTTLWTAAEADVAPTHWSRNYLLFNISPSLSGEDSIGIWALPIGRDLTPGEPIDAVPGDSPEYDGVLSPDERWIAYQTSTSGGQVSDIYVRRFPPDPEGAITPVTQNGGTQVRWGRDGDRLFYLAPDGQMMAAAVVLPDSPGGDIELGQPIALFPSGIYPLNFSGPRYDVFPNGNFLIMRLPRGVPISVIQYWNPEASTP